MLVVCPIAIINLVFKKMKFVSEIFLVYLSVSVAYLFILSIVSIFPVRRKSIKSNKLNKYAILIPAYKENNIIKTVADKAVSHNYPKELFDVYVIADSLEIETIEFVKATGANVIEVSFESSTKAKSLNVALSTIPEDKYDAAVVLDVDNIMEDDFLQEINNSLNTGNRVVQGHRTAKNMNTSTAILDAASEEISNSVIRKGLHNFGFSAMIIGSAFAIEWKLFKRIMCDINDVAGEDRELEIRLLKEKVKIGYCGSAVVLDEKVESWEVFTRQRSRWAAAHFDFVAKYFFPAFYQLFVKFNLDYFNKVWQNLIPPRIILLASLTLMFALSVIFPDIYYSNYWIGIFVVYVISLFIALPVRFYNKKFFAALASLPMMLISMILSWTKIKGQRNKFLHTPHTFDGKSKEL